MPISTQFRMLQTTASLDTILAMVPAVPAQIATNGANVANFPASDLSGSLAYFARSIQNIQGSKLIGDRLPGLVQFNDAIDIDRIGGHNGAAQKIRLQQHDGTNVDGMTVQLNSTATAATSTVLIQNKGGTGVNAIKLETVAAGDILVDSGKDLTLVAAAVLDVDAASSTLDTTGGQAFTAGDDITITAADEKSIFIGEGSGATATRLEVTHDAGAAGNEKIILHNQGGTNVAAIEVKTAAAGGIKLDSGGLILGEATTGVDFVADGNNSFAIFGSSGGGGSEQVQLISSGTSQGAIGLVSKGGIDVTPAQGREVDLGRPSDAQIVVAPHGTPGSRDIRILNTGGTDNKAVEIAATGGGVDVSGQAVVLSGSGATGITFRAPVLSSGLGASAGSGMLFATYAEPTAFAGKSIFSANTTLVGALNILADNVSGQTATIFTGSIAATINANTNVPVGVMTDYVGHNADLVPTVTTQKCQVFLNGQLLLSASAQGGNALENDYKIQANNNLRFQFQLRAGDQIVVVDRS